jgi:hypothetical protein
MRAKHRLGLHEQQRVAPSRKRSREHGDQAALMRLENSSLHLPCRNDKLLAQTRERRFIEASRDWDLYQTC